MKFSIRIFLFRFSVFIVFGYQQNCVSQQQSNSNNSPSLFDNNNLPNVTAEENNNPEQEVVNDAVLIQPPPSASAFAPSPTPISPAIPIATGVAATPTPTPIPKQQYDHYLAVDAYSENNAEDQQDKSKKVDAPIMEIDGSQSQKECIARELKSRDFTYMLTALEIIMDIVKKFTVLIPTNDAMRSFSDDLGVDFEDIFLFEANIAAIREVMMLHIVNVENKIVDQELRKIATLLEQQFLNIDKRKISVVGSKTNSTAEVLHDFQECDISFLVISEVLTPTTII